MPQVDWSTNTTFIVSAIRVSWKNAPNSPLPMVSTGIGSTYVIRPMSGGPLTTDIAPGIVGLANNLLAVTRAHNSLVEDVDNNKKSLAFLYEQLQKSGILPQETT